LPSFPNIRFKSAFYFVPLILINVFLINLPLTNSLGYEFIVINTLVLFFQIGFIFGKELKSELPKNVFSLLKKNYIVLTILLAIPLIIGTLSSLISSRCPIKDGFLFYIVILLPSVSLSFIISLIAAAITKKYNKFIFTLITVIFLLVPLFEFYFLPQIYFYNTIIGFFPGTIYDEDIAVNYKLIFHQIYNLFLFGLAYFLITNLKGERQKQKSLMVFAFFIIASVFLKPVFGFATTKSNIESELKTKITTKHFEIFLGDSVDQAEYEFIALQHEYYYERIVEQLLLNDTPLITSYIFNDKNQMRNLFGAGNADVSKPWMNMVFLNYTNYESTLKHEIAHTVAAKFGVTPFRVADNINMALIEGLAMFIENDFDGFPISYAAKLAYNNNYKVDMNDLFNSGKFFTSYSSLAYIYAGSFLEFIAKNYGVKKLKQLYADLDFENVIGKKFEKLAVQFQEQLKDSAFANKESEAQLYFGGQTIFKKFCARMASNDIKAAKEIYAKKDYNNAEEKFLSAYEYSSSAAALSGYIASLRKQKKYRQAVIFLEKEIKNFSKSQSLSSLELQLADCLLLSGENVKANYYYDLIVEKKPHANFISWIKLLKFIAERESEETLKKFLVSDETERRNLLLSIYNKQKEYSIINFLLSPDKGGYSKIKEITNSIKNEFSPADYDERKTSLEISRFLLKHKQYDDAKHFAIKAVENFPEGYQKYELIENLRLVNWFVNYAPYTFIKVENLK